ncbi:SDR family NAD(P)-dependent oxidoreductase [Actinomycetospora lemnae]|uniref:SDR family NAD(P)-dependent oxidoreductase n=1 Tax=Actinomycetospora lemnae TaxID=3019891 RepID=A0ABT5SMH6_9PSEU|nr:SDR family NAD(P)-dependent oxidoreductase [Actinomycetospora sp. DW7H6]MDD7964049.1 SDR family NAD(P)-dependent oxidoreductase [Actinomycetospora sp. DW7H6]
MTPGTSGLGVVRRLAARGHPVVLGARDPDDLLRLGARVVMVSSGAGSSGEMQGGSGVPAYAVSEAALDMVTVTLAADLRPRGVLVDAVCPGRVATDMGGRGRRSAPAPRAGRP